MLLRATTRSSGSTRPGPCSGCSRSGTARWASGQFKPGDILALYTDGITESFDDSDEEFGEERLVATLQRNRELLPAALLDAVVSDVGKFSPREQRDDITMIVAKRM